MHVSRDRSDTRPAVARATTLTRGVGTAGRAARNTARRTVGAAIGVAVAARLLAAPPSQARPVVSPPTAPDPGEPVLNTGVLVDLAPGARNVRVAESPGGGSVAVSWTVRNASGHDELWARVKDETSWSARVRVSDPTASAVRPSMDLDSDGSLLLAWSEQRGGTRSVVTRRVTDSAAGARKVFAVAVSDGPYVGAGALHDVVAWTAASGGVVRPFASVDHGGGFAAPAAVSSSRWAYDVLPGTLGVNADSPQAHITYLSHDTDTQRAQASWSVLESTKGSAWIPADDLGPRQHLDQPVRPLVAVDHRGVAVLVFHDLSETDDTTRFPSGYVYDPRSPGSQPKDRLDVPKDLGAADAEGRPRALLGVRNRRNVLVAGYAGSPALIKQLVLPSDPGWTFKDWSDDGLCAAYTSDSTAPVWFFTWRQAEAEIHCLDDETTPGSLHIAHTNFGSLSTITPDRALGGTVTGFVPDPLVSALVLTEDVPGGDDPVWLLDHTDGGNDKPDPLLDFAKVKHPAITGKLQVGRTLRAVTGAWRPAPSEVAHRWYVNGRIVKGATRPTLKLTKAHRGKRISVRLFLSRAGYKDRVVEAKRAQKVAPKPKPKPKKKMKKKKKKR